jgi:hypothetical protein
MQTAPQGVLRSHAPREVQEKLIAAQRDLLAGMRPSNERLTVLGPGLWVMAKRGAIRADLRSLKRVVEGDTRAS